MKLLKNTAGGITLRIGKLSIFTDPCDGTFQWLKVSDEQHTGWYFGKYLNIQWNRFPFTGCS